jgi:hypothetical protein
MDEKQTETLDKLFLEWSQFTTAKTQREISLENSRDKYGLALIMIREGATNPQKIASDALKSEVMDA